MFYIKEALQYFAGRTKSDDGAFRFWPGHEQESEVLQSLLVAKHPSTRYEPYSQQVVALPLALWAAELAEKCSRRSESQTRGVEPGGWFDVEPHGRTLGTCPQFMYDTS